MCVCSAYGYGMNIEAGGRGEHGQIDGVPLAEKQYLAVKFSSRHCQTLRIDLSMWMVIRVIIILIFRIKIFCLIKDMGREGI